MGFGPIGVYRAIGFKCGRWHDVAWWQLALRDREGEPAEPLSLERALTTPGWAEALRAGTEPMTP
jgi:phosphinothricin acetyltransferase